MALDSKDPGEAYAIEFDFSAELSNITSVQVEVDFVSGAADPDSALVLDGAPQIIAGGLVRQRVKGGLDKRGYGLRCTATNGVETFVLTSTLPVLRRRG